MIVGQRVHDDDLCGHVLARSAGWTHLKLPAIEDTARLICFPSGRKYRRAAGEPLWEAREGVEQLALMKSALGSAAYDAQYQQEPAPPEGAMIKSAWWQPYRILPAAFDEIIQSWDMAFKGEAGSDYVVGQVWGRLGAKIYLLDQVRGQWDFPRTIDAMLALTEKWPEALLKLVEDTANGPAIIQTLQDKDAGHPGGQPAGLQDGALRFCGTGDRGGQRPCVPDARFISGAEWVEEFLLEFSRFPRGSHDDQVDAATQALGRLVRAAGRSRISIGIIKAAPHRQRARLQPAARRKASVYGGRIVSRTLHQCYSGSNLPDPYGRPSGGSNRPGGAPPGKPHHIF